MYNENQLPRVKNYVKLMTTSEANVYQTWLSHVNGFFQCSVFLAKPSWNMYFTKFSLEIHMKTEGINQFEGVGNLCILGLWGFNR